MTVEEFNLLVSRYGNRVYGYVVFYLGDKMTADDVMQEVLIRLWKKRDEIDRERVLPWLLTVARNACIDEHRRNKNRNNRMTVDSEIVEILADPGSESPDKIVENRIMMEDLTEEVNKLEDPYKSIVVLREIQGFKYGEIAEALDLPLSTIKVYLHRARKKLRHQLMNKLELDHAGH